jgi:hypothetical protein
MRRILLATLALCLSAASAVAQSSTGRLSGTDSTADGVVAGATVTVKDNKTGRERTAVSSEDGTFGVPQLEFGTYTVTITSSGFKTFTAAEVKIDVGREYSLNATLEAGDISETVTVTAGADVMNATTAELSNTVSPKQILELPLNGRNPLGLILLQPGTASNTNNSTSINGQRPSATNITRDGLNIQDNFIRSNASDFTQQTPSTDDIAEFTVTTQNSGADQGYGASQVQLVTQRGQAEWHGGVWEYNRNSRFGANRFFNNAAGSYGPNSLQVKTGQKQVGDPVSPRPFRNFNQFGGKLGGPMPLPKFGEGGASLIRNKAFFFVYYEGLRDRLSSATLRTVLTPSARQGLYTYTATCTNTGTNICPAGITPGQNVTVNLFAVPVTAGVAPTGQALPPIPTGINPTIQQRIIDPLPLGNTAEAGDQRNTTGYRFNQLANGDRNTITSRLDFELNSNNQINFIWNRQRESYLNPDALDTRGFSNNPSVVNQSPSDSYVGSYRWTAGPRFTNEVRAGYIENFPTFSRQPELTNEFFDFSLFSNPESGALFQGRNTKTATFQDNASYEWDNHSLRFGGTLNTFRALRLNEGGVIPVYTLGTSTNSPQIATATFTNQGFFPGGISTTDRGNANALFAILGGIISSQAQTFNVNPSDPTKFQPRTGFRQDYAYENWALYFADQWRVSPRLTLNLGVRYEVYPSTRERNGVITEVRIPEGTDPRAALLDPNGSIQPVGTNVGGGRLFKTDYNNFAPVLSFAYSPEFRNKFLGSVFGGGGRSVIRGGYRISFYNDEFLKASSGEGDQNPGFRLSLTRATLIERVGSQGEIATPAVTVPRTFAANNPQFNNIAILAAVDPNLKTPANHEFNIGYQRELGFQTAFEIRYVGAISRNGTRYSDVTGPVDIENNGFLSDFLIARNNLALTAAERARLLTTGLTQAQVDARAPLAAGFNPNVPGTQALSVFANLGVLSGTPGGIGGVPAAGGNPVAGNASVIGDIDAGLPGTLVTRLLQNALGGNVKFLANPNLGAGLLLNNSARYYYNALQLEVRRRFAGGLYFQGNYTFQKTLTNSRGTDQRRFEFQLDPRRDNLEYGRADYDQTHVFNFNSIYELPFGRGKWIGGGAGPWLDRLIGGWQFNSIVRLASGSPISVVDPRTTFNLSTFSGRNMANSNLTKEELKELFGVFRTPNGIYFINPSVIDPVTGRAANGTSVTTNIPTFDGQVFFNVPPGQVGQLERNAFDGPGYFNIDASLFKNIRIREEMRVQLRLEAFNVLNRANFVLGSQIPSINSSTFGRITSTAAPRVLQFAARFEF